ncbi:Mannan endo-1,6-alpha-mannosidase [Penicillium ucsense]|nr:Mannan endo-1,6-alpha-mannosidase [Penicillium ucsense]
MRPPAPTRALAGHMGSSLFVLMLTTFCLFATVANALAHGPQRPLAATDALLSDSAMALGDMSLVPTASKGSDGASDGAKPMKASRATQTLEDLLDAINVMQKEYFVLWQGTWPSSIDWTAAVLGTHVAATLSTLSSTAYHIHSDSVQGLSLLALENTINYFFSQTSAFYFGENAFSLRNQAYDDMLWVVLDWLENVKFQDLHSSLYYSDSNGAPANSSSQAWYGTQFRDAAAHRARIFYELASVGWDQTLCDGGMIWNPTLIPYKNAITNELFTSASIEMYLYFPGDPIDSPFIAAPPSNKPDQRRRHDPAYLKAAIDAYTWLKNSNMTGVGGLYADGFHISGWRSATQPGSRRCDELNTMLYSYNQGVVLSALRGLWLATGELQYLRDGHDLVRKTLRATGWPHLSSDKWAGLGRGGVMEDTCDSHASCSQDGQTFKGIFFHHLAEFCRPLRPQEAKFLEDQTDESARAQRREDVFTQHLGICRAYGPWVEHNARAALETRDADGKFGQWWGLPFQQKHVSNDMVNSSTLPSGADDYRNRKSDTAVTPLHLRPRDFNDRGRGRTVETQAGGLAVLRALLQWQTSEALS